MKVWPREQQGKNKVYQTCAENNDAINLINPASYPKFPPEGKKGP